MVDVTKENFHEVMNDVLRDIRTSSFVAVDTEFTGLLVDSIFKNR